MKLNIKNGLVIALLALSVSACEKRGPAEKAGERVDEVISNVKDGESPLHKKGAAEKAGESIDRAVQTIAP